MGRLIPKTYLRWREPAAAVRTREALAKLPRWFRPAATLVCFVLLLLPWLLTFVLPNRHPLPFWQVGPGVLAMALVMVYVFPLIYRFCPSDIRITERGIRMDVANSRNLWTYRDLKSCRVVLDGAEVRLLELTIARGETVIIGIAPSVSTEELVRVLTTCGIETEVMPAVQQEG